MKGKYLFVTTLLFLTLEVWAAEVSVTPRVTVTDAVHFLSITDNRDTFLASEFTDTEPVPFGLTSGTGTATVNMHGDDGYTWTGRYGFVNFYVQATVPARTKRTFTLEFDVGFTKTSKSGATWMTDLIKGSVLPTGDYAFNTSKQAAATGDTVLRVLDDSSKNKNAPITIRYEVDNCDSDTEKTDALKFVLFGGYRVVGIYTPITDHFCTIKSVKYNPEEDIPASTVTYNYTANGGDSASKSFAQYMQGQEVDLLPTAAKNGWAFVGWNTNKDAHEKLDSYTMPGNDTTLYAIFRRQCTVTFYIGVDKTLAVDAYIYNKDDYGECTTIRIPDWNVTDDTGWQAFGWTTQTDTFDSQVTAGEKIKFSSDIILCPVYKNTVTLSYNANGGTGLIPSKQAVIYANINKKASYSESAQFTLSEGTALARTGYTFDGWLERSATGTERAAGESVSISGNWTYWANWKANVYTITFVGNLDGNKGTEGKASIQYTYAKGVMLDSEEWVKVGHTFLGWYEQPDFTGKSVTVISATDWGDKKFFAKYSPHVYSEDWSASDESHWHECICNEVKDKDLHDYSDWELKSGAVPGHAIVILRTCSECNHTETAEMHKEMENEE